MALNGAAQGERQGHTFRYPSVSIRMFSGFRSLPLGGGGESVESITQMSTQTLQLKIHPTTTQA